MWRVHIPVGGGHTIVSIEIVFNSERFQQNSGKSDAF